MRKIKTIKTEIEKAKLDSDNALLKLKEVEELAKEAEKEEAENKERIVQDINNICSTSNLFCGIILTPDDILKIVQLAIESKENIKIPFQLYFND